MKARIQYMVSLVLYGTTGMILRWTAIPSELLVLARGAIGAVLIFLFLLIQGKKPSVADIRRNGKWLILGGISLGLNWVFLFGAYRYTTVALASLCNYTAPIIVIFLSPFLFGEKLTVRKLLCVLAAALGISLVSGVFAGEGTADPIGLLLGMGASLGFVGIIICNKRLSGVSPYDRVIVQLLISALTVLPYAFFQNMGSQIQADAGSIFWMLVLAVVHTAFAYCCYFGAMADLPVQTIALWGYIEPVVSVLCSALILKEPLGAAGIIGSIMVLTSAAVSELLS